MLNPTELAREPALDDKDVIVGAPVAAHQEGDRTLIGARTIIEELGRSRQVQDSALYLFLNYPEAKANHETTRASFAAAGRLAVESRYLSGIDVIPFHASADNCLIGGIRRTLWNTIEARGQLDSNPACLSTDIDIASFRSKQDRSCFDVVTEHMQPGNIGSFYGEYGLGSMLDEIRDLLSLKGDRLDILDELRLGAVSSAVVALDSSNLGNSFAEAAFFFKGKLYRKAGGHDPLVRVGETMDLQKRMQTMYRRGPLVEDAGINFSPRRNVQSILDRGTLEKLWFSEEFPFDNANRYRNTDDMMELYFDAANLFMEDPVEFMGIVMSDRFLASYDQAVTMRDVEVAIEEYEMPRNGNSWLALEAVASVVSGWAIALAVEYHLVQDPEARQLLEQRLKNVLPKFSIPIGDEFCESLLEAVGERVFDINHQSLDNEEALLLVDSLSERLIEIGLDSSSSWSSLS